MKLVVSFELENLKNIEILKTNDNVNLIERPVFVALDTLKIQRFLNLVNQYGTPQALVSNAHPEYLELSAPDIDYHYLPDFLYWTARNLVNGGIVVDRDPEYCFNFIINKKRINRYLLLKLIEWFELSSYRYTWSGIGKEFDMSRCIAEFDLIREHVDIIKFQNHILSSSFKILPHFVDNDLTINDTVAEHNDSSKVNYGNNTWVWNNVVGDIFSKSAVSLITESIEYEKHIHYTEKTLYSVMGLTFPIWVGGYQQANLWQQHGFDTFDDIINHDYQYRETLLERCFYAIKDNLKILTDLSFAKNKKQQNMQRLQNNRFQMVENIQNIYKRSLSRLPKNYKVPFVFPGFETKIK